jgi:hypothetical protein
MIAELWTRDEPEANGFDSRMHFSGKRFLPVMIVRKNARAFIVP